MKITSQIYSIVGILFFVLVGSPNTSTAGVVELTPAIKLATGYDDNIDFTSDSSKAEDDFYGRAVPGMSLKYTTERLDFLGRGEVDFKKYLNQTDFDRTNQFYEARTQYQAHPRWQLTGNYSFRRDETTDLHFEETGRAFERRRVLRHDARAGVQFALTELSDIGSFANYSRADYSGRNNTDYDYYQIELPYTKRFRNQIDTISLTPMYTRYRSDDNEEGDGYRLSLFWEHLLSETLTFDVTAGGRYTKIKEQDGNTNSNLGAIGNIGLTKEGETFRGGIRYSHDLRPTSQGEIVNVDRLWTFVDKLITERFGFRFTGNAYHSNRENRDAPDDKVISFGLNPGLYYLLTENHSVELTYRYRNQRELDEPGNPVTQSNNVELSFNFVFPRRWD